MIIRFLLFSLPIIFGIVLTVDAQTSLNLKARIILRNSIFEGLNKPGKSEFKSEEKIFAQLELTNESSEETWLVIGQQWRYLRPKLVRDGKVVPYKAEIQQLLKEGNPFYSPVINITLKHKVAVSTDNVHLDYWYDKLEPGHYTISVERMWMKQTFVSNDADFDIVS